MARRLLAPTMVLALATAWLLATALPAAAACHVAGFVESEVATSPDAGVVSLVVELQGRVASCAGTVEVATVDGSATAGEDYEAVMATLAFEEGDDRVETVEVPILADAAPGGTFTLELSDPTGGITGTSGPATVTIVAGGDTTGDAGEGDPGDEGASDDEAGDDEAGDDEADRDEADGGGGGGTVGIVLAVLAALAIGGGSFAVLRGRG